MSSRRYADEDVRCEIAARWRRCYLPRRDSEERAISGRLIFPPFKCMYHWTESTDLNDFYLKLNLLFSTLIWGKNRWNRLILYKVTCIWKVQKMRRPEIACSLLSRRDSTFFIVAARRHDVPLSRRYVK